MIRNLTKPTYGISEYMQRDKVKHAHLDFFPQVLGGVRALDGLDVQVAHAIVLADGGVARVGQRARALVAEARHVVLVPER